MDPSKKQLMDLQKIKCFIDEHYLIQKLIQEEDNKYNVCSGASSDSERKLHTEVQ